MNFFTFGSIYTIANALGVLSGPGVLDLEKLQANSRSYCKKVSFLWLVELPSILFKKNLIVHFYGFHHFSRSKFCDFLVAFRDNTMPFRKKVNSYSKGFKN